MPAVTRTLAAATVITFALALAGCASGETAANGSGPSLADTKSPVQLLRNEAADRIPAGVIADVIPGNDSSSACKTVGEDPEGRERFWASDVRVELTPETTVELVLSKLLISFTSDGWVKSEDSGSASFQFTREGSAADVNVTTEQATENSGGAVIVSVQGPCVMTAGADSDEVRKLEASGN